MTHRRIVVCFCLFAKRHTRGGCAIQQGDVVWRGQKRHHPRSGGDKNINAQRHQNVSFQRVLVELFCDIFSCLLTFSTCSSSSYMIVGYRTAFFCCQYEIITTSARRRRHPSQTVLARGPEGTLAMWNHFCNPEKTVQCNKIP